MKTQTTRQTVEVRADGEGLVSHAGAFLLVELADRLGLTKELSAAMAPTRERRSAHDPGVVLRDLAVAIADGGDHVTDLGVLRGQEALFGPVASETTAHRVLKSIGADLLEAIRAARAVALARAWDARSSTRGADPRHRRLAAHRPLREARCRRQLQGRLRLSPAALLPGRDRRASGRDPAPRQRRRPHRCRSLRGACNWRSSKLPAEDLHREILARADIGGRTHAFTAGLPRRRHPLLGRLRGRRAGARERSSSCPNRHGGARSTAMGPSARAPRSRSSPTTSTSPAGPREHG